MSDPEHSKRRVAKIISLLVIAILVPLTMRWWNNFITPKPTAVPPAAPQVAPAAPTVPSPERTPVAPPIAPRPVSVKNHEPSATPTMIKPVTPPKKPKVPIPYHPYVPPPMAPPPAEILEWRGGDSSITHSGQIVVRTNEQWIHFWTEHHPDEASPDVDFSKYLVIGVFVGSRPADQFSVVITNVSSQNGSLVVTYQEKTPPPGTFEAGVEIHPYDLKAIPRTNLPIKFEKINPNPQ